MRALTEVRAVPGNGMEGDRYFSGAGTFTGDQRRDSEVTLMALEDLHAMEQETGVRLSPGDMRRNVVTQGADLRALVGLESAWGRFASAPHGSPSPAVTWRASRTSEFSGGSSTGVACRPRS
jgi:hypothetical protein